MVFIYFKAFSTLVLSATVVILFVFDYFRRRYGGRQEFISVLVRKSIAYKGASDEGLSVIKSIIFRLKRLFFVQFCYASRNSGNILLFDNKERLIFLFWLFVITSVSWIYLIFAIFWSLYWLVLITRGIRDDRRVMPSRDRTFLTPNQFRSVWYERGEVETDYGPNWILHAHHNGLMAHVLEILLWLIVKVPYYRSFCVVSKISIFYLPKEKSATTFYTKTLSFLRRLILFLKNFLFKQIFSIPILFVRFALKTVVGYRESPIDSTQKMLSLKEYLYRRVLIDSIRDPEFTRLDPVLAILYPIDRSRP